jgi:hypothetical protein
MMVSPALADRGGAKRDLATNDPLPAHERTRRV